MLRAALAGPLQRVTYFTTARYLPERLLLEGDSRLQEVPTGGARDGGEMVLLTAPRSRARCSA